uniref:PDZ domain-containing protein n=1 Tax=Panagrellus redivivus TaxID=6233 RepID=A0A7E4VGW3_PANRE
MKLLACFPIFACKGKVDALDFSCAKLEIIPDIVFKNAKSLEDLNLSVNRIADVPLSFFKMPKLQRLILSYNNIESIPAAIGDLTQLIELDLSNNELIDIAEEIEKCTNLVVLNVSNNILPSGGIPNTIVNLPQMTHLNMSNTAITNLPADIDKLECLKFLNVSECDLRALPASLVKLKNLQHLDVMDNFLSELPSGFGNLESLKELNLEKNELTSLPDDLLKCKNLESLVVSRNRLSSLPTDIGELVKLIELDAHSNEIEEIPTSIRHLVNLQILRLYSNVIREVPMSIGNLSSLIELYLGANLLQTLPSNIGFLKKLTFLDVSNNLLNELPSTIGQLDKLGSLLLRGNKLTSLPLEIGRLKSLRVLDIVDNQLEDLPYTLIVLKDTLRAIYITADRPMKINVLKESRDKVTGGKILVHYMLPQAHYAPPTDTKSTVGGPRVNWGSDVPPASANEGDRSGLIDPDQSIDNAQPLERHDTPHPKNFAPKYQKMLQNKRLSRELEAAGGDPADVPEVAMRPLRSVLKSRPTSTISNGFDGNANCELVSIILRKQPDVGFGWTIYGGVNVALPFKDDDYGFFVSKLEPYGPAEVAKVNVGDKIIAVNGRPISRMTHDQALSLMDEADDGEVVSFEIVPIHPDRPINPSPPASASPPTAAIVPAVANQPQKSISKASLVSDGPPTEFAPPTPAATSEPPIVTTERISVTIQCDSNGSSGFTVSGSSSASVNAPVCINDIVPGGPAALTRKLRPGDRILSINGTNVQALPLGAVQTLLRAGGGAEMYLVVERIHFNSTHDLTRGLLAPSRSMPSLVPEAVSAFAPYAGPARKPTNIDSAPPVPTKPTTFLVELSREPPSAFAPTRAKSYSDLASPSAFATSPTPSVASPAAPVNRSLETEAPVAMPTPSPIASPIAEKPASPPRSTVSSIPVPTPSTPSPKPEKAMSPPPTKANILAQSKIPQPVKVPPPVAPKPPKVHPTKEASPTKPPEKESFSAKLARFNSQIASQSASTSTLRSAVPPPKKVALIGENDILRMKEDLDRSASAAGSAPIAADEDNGVDIDAYESMLDNIVSPSLPLARSRNTPVHERTQSDDVYHVRQMSHVR